MVPTPPHPGWVFLDRDGTINVPAAPHEYVTAPDALRLLPGAAEAIRQLNRAGWWVGVVTNQRGVGLGRMTARDLDAVHARLRTLLGDAGAHLDGIWSCPHLDGECDCRKPAPGLLLRAAAETPGLDLARSWMIGDSPTDTAAGRAAGASTLLLGEAERPGERRAPDLLAAVEGILGSTAA